MGLSLVPVTSANHGNFASGATLTLPNPSTTIGDYLVAIISYNYNSNSATMTQSGWTLLYKTNPSGNSGAAACIFGKFVSASDPANFAWSLATAATCNASIVAITGGVSIANTYVLSALNTTTASPSQGPYTVSANPSFVGALPIAYFGAANINTTDSTVHTIASGWSQVYTEGSSPNANYGGVNMQQGSITTDTTQQTASATWAQYTDGHGYAVMFIFNPAQAGPLVSTPASNAINVTGIGAASQQQCTIAQSDVAGPITLVARASSSSAPGQVSLASTQNGTYGSTLTVYGPSATYWMQGVTPGETVVDINGG